MRICIANLGAYNEGRLVCRWLELPCTDAELETALQAIDIGGRYEELFITDYETDFGLRVGEYDRLETLNEIAERVNSLDTYELQTLQAILEYEAYDASDMEEVLDRLGEYNLYADVDSDEDLGHYWVHEGGCYDLDSMGSLANFIDYQAFGRAIRLETSGEYTTLGWLERCG